MKKKRKIGQRSSEADVIIRRNKVRRYLIRGLNVSEVSQLEGVTERTVQMDIEAIKEAALARIKDLSDNEVAIKVVEGASERIRELWNLYHNSKNDNVKIQALRALAEEDEKLIKTCQRLGLIYEEPFKHRLDQREPLVIELKPYGKKGPIS